MTGFAFLKRHLAGRLQVICGPLAVISGAERPANDRQTTRSKTTKKFMERETTSARRISAPDPRHMTAFIICGHMAGVAASFAGDLVRPLGRTRASNRVIWDQRVTNYMTLYARGRGNAPCHYVL